MEKQIEKGLVASAPCVTSAWVGFAENLATVLENLQEEQYLILIVDGTNSFVQFAGRGAKGLCMETTSNHYLDKESQLSQGQIAMLQECGWNPPTNAPDADAPEKEPGCSSNFYIDYPLPVPCNAAAELTVKTFTEILGVSGPEKLVYQALADDGNSQFYPDLGVQRDVRLAHSQPEVMQQRLLATIREHTGLADLEFDQDGDIVVTFGSMVAFIRCQADPPLVRFHSPVLSNIEPSPRLYERLNELNIRGGYLHFFYDRNRVVAVTDIPGAPLVFDHVVQAMQRFCELVDDVDDILAAEFGGNVAHPERMPSLLTH